VLFHVALFLLANRFELTTRGTAMLVGALLQQRNRSNEQRCWNGSVLILNLKQVH
jgi:hypothetical protein